MDRTSQAAFVGVTGLGPKLVGGSSSDARAASGATNVRKRASTSYIVYPYDGGRLGLPPLAPAGALAASDPAVPGASQLPASDRNLGRTVVISLAVLFATVSLGQLGWLRARVLGDRKHLDPLESPTVLDTSVPRSSQPSSWTLPIRRHAGPGLPRIEGGAKVLAG